MQSDSKTMISRSDDCASTLHDMCGRCQCECHGHEFSLEEVKVLYKLLEHQYISYENLGAHEVTNKIMRIVREHESKPELD